MLEFEAGISGLFTGAGYGVIAVSITLMYRSTGVLSFAHAAFAAVAAYLYIDLVDQGWAKPLAAAAGVATATAYGIVVERVAVRPVRHADPATRLIATLGVLTFTTGVLLWQYGFSPIVAEPLFPDRSVDIGGVAIAYQKVAVLVLAVVAAIALAVFLERTRLGTGVRAVAQDAEAARLHGVSPTAVSRLNWALGAGLAGLIGVLIAPLQSVNVGTFTLLLAKALTATLIGGLASLIGSFAGGLLLGVIENVTIVRSATPGAPELMTVVVVVLVLVFRRNWPAGPAATSASVQRRPSPRTARLTRGLAMAGPPLAAVGLVGAIVVPAVSPYWSFVGARSLFFVLEALALVLLVGWAGQVSLMQGAYVGIGAFGTGWLVVEHGLPLALALLISSVAGTALGAVVGLPALRLSGLQFAVASLAFAAAAAAWLFEWDELPRSMPRRDLLGLDLQSDIAVYFVTLATTSVVMLLLWNLRRSSQGSLLLAARDAAATVDHFGASARRARLGAFLLASFVATLGGGLYAVLLTGLSAADFAPFLSLTLLVYYVVGGSQSLLGPVLAGLAFGVLPQVLQSDAGTTASATPTIVAGAAVVLLLAVRPLGLASLFAPPTPPMPPPSAASDHYLSVQRRLSGSTPPRPQAVARRLRAGRHHTLVRQSIPR